MKKLIAMLLVVVMAASVAVTVAAETDTAATFEAPTILGYQVGDYVDENGNKVDGFVNIRFVSYVKSLDGDMLGYNIDAYYTQKYTQEGSDEVAAKGARKTFGATDDDTSTENSVIYSSIYEDGVKKSVTEYDADAKGFFLYSIKKIPVNTDINFEFNAYVKANDEIVAVSDSVIMNYDADNTVKGALVPTTYDFNDAAVTPETFGASGRFADVDQFNIVDGKLTVAPNLKWHAVDNNYSAFLTLLSNDKLRAALDNGNGGYYQSYVVSMDVEVPYAWTPSAFTLVMNSDGSAADVTGMLANSVGTRLQSVKSGAIQNGNNMGVNILSYNSSASATTSWGNSVGITSAHETAGTIKVRLTVAYTAANGSESGRIDTYADGVWKNKNVVNASAVSNLKFDESGELISDIALVAQSVGDGVKIDNLTVSVPVNEADGVVNASTNALNSLRETYKADYENRFAEEFGIAPIASTANKAPATLSITENGGLSIKGGAWGSHLMTLAPADVLNADNGKVVIDMKLAMNNGKAITVMFVNSVSTDTSLVPYKTITNTGTIGYRLTAKDKGMQNWIVSYNSAGAQLATFGNNTLTGQPSNEFDIRIIADGSTYSMYINGVHCVTHYFSEDSDKVINENTSIVLWAENADAIISDLTISTFQSIE